jgi:magnesium-transporting ATPase (P-type)
MFFASAPQDFYQNFFGYSLFPSWVLGGVASNILAFVTFACIGGSLIFMSNTLERDIQQRKVPFFTYFLLATEIAIIAFGAGTAVALNTSAFSIVQTLLGVIVYVWVVSLVLVALNIVIAYIKVAAQATGSLRSRAVLLLVSLLVVFVVLVLREFINPPFLPDGIGILFAFGLYKGVLMD